jgi:sporulation protein YlmC with PRC-barrel domain
MKRSIKSLTGYKLNASNGEIGRVEEFFFDDETLTMRYLVVKTGSWLFGKKVLIPTEAVNKPDWEEKNFPVNLTIEEIENSPDIDTDKPVSRIQEMNLYQHLGWPHYWSPGAFSVGVWGLTGTVPITQERVNSNPPDYPSDADHNVHLRSTRELTGYLVYGINGEVGKLEDFIIDDDTWQLDFLVVDTGNWLSGKKVLLSPRCITEISWSRSSIFVNMPSDEIESRDEYDPYQPVNIVEEHHFYDYYGRPRDEQ